MPSKKKIDTIGDVPEVIDIPTEESEMSPAEYFEKLKSKRETMTDEKLNHVYDNAMNFDAEHSKKLSMKNEFYFTKILFTSKKKRYVARPMLQEGSTFINGTIDTGEISEGNLELSTDTQYITMR